MSAGLDASTATPGSTPPLESFTSPVMALCADAAAGRNTPTSDTARIAAKRTLRRIRTSRGERVATWLDVSPGTSSVNGIVRVLRHVWASCPNSWIRLQFLAPGDGRNHEILLRVLRVLRVFVVPARFATRTSAPGRDSRATHGAREDMRRGT